MCMSGKVDGTSKEVVKAEFLKQVDENVYLGYTFTRGGKIDGTWK